MDFFILALLPIGHQFLSISSYIVACVFIWWSSTRTELLQKWSLLVRIRTIVERISICFFEPGDLLFRPDSGQMEEDLVALQLAQSSQIIFEQEELLQQQAQSEAKLIFYNKIEYLFWIENNSLIYYMSSKRLADIKINRK